jgi:hypothetical protein
MPLQQMTHALPNAARGLLWRHQSDPLRSSAPITVVIQPLHNPNNNYPLATTAPANCQLGSVTGSLHILTTNLVAELIHHRDHHMP